MPQHSAWHDAPAHEFSLLPNVEGERLSVTPHTNCSADLYGPVIAWVLVA
jgi:hypothetical protein